MNQNEKNIKDVITEIFTKEKRLSNNYNSFTVDAIWRQTFGDLISSYTTSVKLHKGILTVYINSSALKQELSMNKAQIIAKMNQNIKYKKINELIIR